MKPDKVADCLNFKGSDDLINVPFIETCFLPSNWIKELLLLPRTTTAVMMVMSGLWQDVQSISAQLEKPNQAGCGCIDGINVSSKNQMRAIKQTSESVRSLEGL